MGYRCDIVVDGPDATWFEPGRESTDGRDHVPEKTHLAEPRPDRRAVLRLRPRLPEEARGRLPAQPRRDRARRHGLRRRGRSRSPMRVIEIFGADSDGTRPALARRVPPRRPQLHRLRSRGDHRRRALRVLDAQPRIGRRRGAVLRRDRLRARPARQAAHAHLPSRGRRASSPPTRCCPRSTPTSALRSSRRARPTAASTTTSGCRARRRPCSLSSDDRPGDARPVALDVGLLSPVTVGFDDVGDGCRVPRRARHRRGRARPRAWRAAARRRPMSSIASRAPFGWTGAGEPCSRARTRASARSRGSVAGGNPVIPLVGR